MGCDTFFLLIWSWAGLGLLIFILLLFVTAPYGRHSRKDWGPTLPNRVGWIVMELPSLLAFSLAFLFGPGKFQPVAWIFFALYAGHYLNRSMVYPLRTRTAGKQMPLVVALMAVCFNLVNGFINGHYFSACSRVYTWDWLADARFIIGTTVLLAGVFLNWWSDQILLDLRKGGRKGYFIPRGGLFRWVSCPNFLGRSLNGQALPS